MRRAIVHSAEAVPQRARKLARKLKAPLPSLVAMASQHAGGSYEVRVMERALVARAYPELTETMSIADPPKVLRLATQRHGAETVEWTLVPVS